MAQQQESSIQIVKRLEGSVDEILQMYALAERVYPYANLHAEKPKNELDQRRQAVEYQVESPFTAISQPTLFPLVFAYGATRVGAKGLFDMSQVWARPSRTVGFLLLGSSLITFMRLAELSQKRKQSQTPHNLNLRVQQNEQTHSILKTMKFHLNSRQMGVHEQSPQ